MTNAITDDDVMEADGLYLEWLNAIRNDSKQLRVLTDKFFVAVREYNKASAERDELRAQLDAVPVEALSIWWDPFRQGLTEEAINNAVVAIEAWLKAQAVTA